MSIKATIKRYLFFCAIAAAGAAVAYLITRPGLGLLDDEKIAHHHELVRAGCVVTTKEPKGYPPRPFLLAVYTCPQPSFNTILRIPRGDNLITEQATHVNDGIGIGL